MLFLDEQHDRNARVLLPTPTAAPTTAAPEATTQQKYFKCDGAGNCKEIELAVPNLPKAETQKIVNSAGQLVEVPCDLACRLKRMKTQPAIKIQ